MAIEANRTAAKTYRQMQREFVAAHRPRLHIRHVEFRGDDNNPSIDFTLINVGESTATLIESSVKPLTLSPNVQLPPKPDYAPATDRPRTRQLKSGEAKTWSEIDLPGHYDLIIGHALSAEFDTFLLGYIVYSDDIGIHRRFGFCYCRRARADHFERIKDRDYNYSD